MGFFENIGLFGNYNGTPDSEHLSPQHRRHIDVCQYISRQFKDKSIRILDVGSGTGLLAKRLQALGFENIFGVDWLPLDKVTHASSFKEYHKIDLNSGAIRPLFNGTQFDLVISSDVMEHMENPTDFLRKIKDVIKPQGHIIITVPNAFNIFQRICLLLTGNTTRYRLEKPNEFGHISLFTENIFLSLANRAHLTVVESLGGACFVSRYCILPKVNFSRILSYNIIYCLSSKVDSN